MHKRKDEIRDIYRSSTRDFEKDFTPQVAEEVLETHRRDLRRSRTASFFFGSLVIVLSVVLIATVLRDFLKGRTLSGEIPVEKTPYILRHPLPENALWLMDYPPVPAASDSEDPKTAPVSAKWIRKTAHYIIMGQQALMVNEPERALEYFNKTAGVYPEIEGLHRALGQLYLQRKEYPQAAEHLEKAVKEEELLETVSSLGSAYIGTEEYEKAEKCLKRAHELQPESPVCYKNLAVLYRKMKRDNDAVYHFEKYLDMQPDDLDTMQTYALYLTELGRWKNAAASLTALTKEMTDVAPVYFLLAQVQIQNGQQDKVIEALKRGIQLVDPELALAWMSRDEFNPVRNTAEFKTLTDQLKITAISPEKTRLPSPAR